MEENKLKVTKNGFVSSTLKLLEKEREAEIEESRLLTEKLPAKELQRRGVCLLKLFIASRQAGLFGRVIIVFETRLEALPSHSITPGDIIGLNQSQSDANSESLGSGVVTKVGANAVTIAFDDSQDLYNLPDDFHDYYKITKLANNVTYKRIKRALGHLEKYDHNESSHLVDVLFGEAELRPPAETQDIHFINPNLDGSQRDAVLFSLGQRDVAVVHGPPGTGKTTTVIEIILQAVNQGNKVLACAPSNIAVDNLVERLAAGGKNKIVRLGHPARLLAHLQKYCLDAILATSEETRLVEDVRRDLDKAMSSLRKERDRGSRQKIQGDMKFLRKELRQRADTATRDILRRADVVLVTLTSATDDGPLRLLDKGHFDVVVIDEVSQSLEAACWIPLLRSGKCVLAGDHLQLPPTILSREAAKEGLEVTLMERVLALYGDEVMRMLTTQYRMNTKVMQWSSDQLYQSKLLAHASVSDHLLRDLPEVEDNEITSIPLLYIDTAGCDLTELDLPEEISKGNEGEADIVAAHVGQLVTSGLTQKQVAVIAPYNLQVELIRLRLAEKYPKVEVKSVDGFQGREKEAVIISLVRSNKKGEVGFLSERRRINVAVTRARRHLTVVGDSVTVSKDPFLKSLIEYLNAEGEVQTAQQFINDGVVGESTASRPDHLNDLMDAASVPRQTSNNKGARPKAPKSAPKSAKQNRKQDKQHLQQPPKEKFELQQEAAPNNQVEEIQSQLDQFVGDERLVMLEFPTTLTSHDRFLVHELSEKMNLGHTSKGVGEERYIVVTKPSQKQETVPESSSMHYGAESNKASTKSESDPMTKKSRKKSAKGNKENIEENDVLNQVKNNSAVVDSPVAIDVNTDNDGKVQCKVCGKSVIKANIVLHEIHCAKSQNQESSAKTNDKKKKPVTNSSKPRQFDKELAKKMETIEDDDFDTLLETVKKADNFCCFKKCKRSVQTLCDVCKYCEGRYCLSHHMPEVHGCGAAAKSAARAQISRDGVLHRGSGVPNRKLDDAKKAHLQRKLDGKLTDLASKRKGKPKK